MIGIGITISTPALVFPALSVLILAYTNRFIAISKRVRALHAEHIQNPDENILQQILSLKKRLLYIRNTQTLAITGFLLNVLSIFLILIGHAKIATYIFAFGLVCIMASLVVCLMEIYMSVHALNIALIDCEE
jgi:hypothetical protein